MDFEQKTSTLVRYRRHRVKKTKKRNIILSGVIFIILVAVAIFSFQFFYDTPSDTKKALAVSDAFSTNLVSYFADILENVNEENVNNAANSINSSGNKAKIVIDPAFGGRISGNVAQGAKEKDINLNISLNLKAKLEALGYQVALTRSDDRFVSTNERAEIARTVNPELFISIQQNCYSDKSIRGIETFFNSSNSVLENEQIAKLINENVAQLTLSTTNQVKAENKERFTSSLASSSFTVKTGNMSNADELNLLLSPENQESIAEKIAAGIEAFYNRSTVYLTFDDGPKPNSTPLVLDALKERNIKATFYLVGENVRRYPELAKRIVEEGHTVAVHCNQHEYSILYASLDSYIRDFDLAYNAIVEVTGQYPTSYRFPGGSFWKNKLPLIKEISKTLSARGFTFYDWDLSIEDAVAKSSPESIVANVNRIAQSKQSGVLLAHDISKYTSTNIGAILDAFAEYQKRVITEQTPPVQFVKVD